MSNNAAAGSPNPDTAPTPGPATATRIAHGLRSLLRGGPVVALLLVVIALSVGTGRFLTTSNVLNISRQASINAILACGMTMVIVTAGIDLSVGSILAVSGCVFALLFQDGYNPVLAIFIGLLTGAFAGMINGLVVTKWRIPAFIATLGMMQSARGVALLITKGTPVTAIPDFVIAIGNEDFLGVPISALIALSIVVLTWLIMRFTFLGRSIYAIGGNQEAARLAGIPVNRNLVVVYTLMGIYCGVAGVVMSGRIYSANGLMGGGLELKAIAATIIGGTNLFGGEGSVWGSLVGALIMACISNGLNLLNVSAFWQAIVLGALIVIVVYINQLRLQAIAG
jgi:ribose/xylose/arabinose/galactoside ABC-type transport system permease subunit